MSSPYNIKNRKHLNTQESSVNTTHIKGDKTEDKSFFGKD